MSAQFCCDVFPLIAQRFIWFYYSEADGEKTWAMPAIRIGIVDWRVNHCPSCGKECRGITLTDEQFKTIQP
jgi:hypothetical protein